MSGRATKCWCPASRSSPRPARFCALGAKPVFVDIDPVTFNISPKLLEAAVTSATKAIIPVHLFGQAADMPAIQQFAREHSLAIVEDAAQAIGSAYEGRPAGSWGEIGCLSFYPTKNLGGFGDGGMMVTSDQALAERLQLLRGHGMKPRYYHQEVGINSRLDALQAAVLNVKLTQLASWTALRQQHAQRYGRWLSQAGMGRNLVLPSADPHVTHVWNQYTVRVLHGQRDPLRPICSNWELARRSTIPCRCISRSVSKVWATVPAVCRKQSKRPRKSSVCQSFRN